MKRTWKGRGLGSDEIRAALQTSRNLSEAARALDVNRSTLHRWMKADPSLDASRQERCAVTEQTLMLAERLNPESWARAIEAAHPLDDTQRVLLDLARRALEIAHGGDVKPVAQLAAMGRFQRLVEQLKLNRLSEKTKPRPEPPPPRPERLADPRAVLKAVK